MPMATFRVPKTHGYTIMSHYHLNDKTISLKAKGLLSQMLSLPQTWDYTLRGLAYINKENIDAIRTAVLELEQHGYITRQRGRDDNGKIAGIEYTIYEQPQIKPQGVSPPCLENPNMDNPIVANPNVDNPNTDAPTLENPTQSITYITNTKKSKTDESNIHTATIHPINLSRTPRGEALKRMDGMDDAEAYRKLIMANIEYDILVERWGNERLDEVVELLLETVLSKREYIRIAGDDYPREVVKSRLLKVNASHVEYVFDCIDKNTTKVHNIKAYLLTAFYNSPATMDSFYRAEVNHDLHGY